MWPFDSEEEELAPDVAEFRDVANEIYDLSENTEAGLAAMQDLYSSYGFEDSLPAKNIFVDSSDRIRQKFGDTKPFNFQETMEYAPINFSEIEVESQDEEEAKLERIDKWEAENLKNLSETSDLGYLQGRSQLERGIKQAATIQRRQYYGSDNYIVTDLALRAAQGAIGPLADLVGAESVGSFFEEQTDPDRDDSYWSAIASGAGSAAGAIGAGLATGGVGTAAYLAASGAGAVREQVEASLENEGTLGQAAVAGGIEAVSQLAQVGVGTKVLGGAVSKILGKSAPELGARVFPRIVKNALMEGSTEAAGQVASNLAKNIGQNREDDIFQGVGQAGVAGFVVGGAASGIGEAGARVNEALSFDMLDSDVGESVNSFGIPAPGGESLLDVESNLAANQSPEVGEPSQDVSPDYPTKLEAPSFDKNSQLDIPTIRNLVGDSEIGADAVLNLEERSPDTLPTFKEIAAEIKRVGKEQGLSKAEIKAEVSRLEGKLSAPQTFGSLEETIQSLEGTPPPPAESIPAGRQSITPEGPVTPVMELSDGSKVIESDGLYHLTKDDNVLQAYESVKYVTPEVAEQLRNLTNTPAPDGTAITLTLDKKGNLVADSAFVNPDLTVKTTKNRKSKTPIKVAESSEGSVPVFVSRTRTTDGVRQNPFFIAPGEVSKSIGAAEVGFGNQRESEYLTNLRFKYGPEVSEDINLSVESFEQEADGTITAKQIPLATYFITPQTEESGNPARAFIDEKTFYGAMDHLRKLDRFNQFDQDVASFLVARAQKAYFEAFTKGDIQNAAALSGILEETIRLNEKVGGVFGTGLGRRTEAAQGRILGKNIGELKVSQLQTDLLAEAAREYETEVGEPLNLPALTEQAKVAEAEMKAVEPAPVKEGETQEPLSPELQKKYDAAKEKFDKVAEKLRNAQQKIQEKLSKLTPEDQATLTEMHDLLDVTQPGTLQNAIAEKIFEIESKLITKDSSPDAFQRIYNFYRSNLLSGPSTQERNFLGNFSSAFSNVVGLAASGEVGLAYKYADAWLKATPGSLREAGLILQGKRGGRFKFDEKVRDSKGNIQRQYVPPLNNPFTQETAGEAAKAGLTFIQNAMYRLLNAQDAVFYRNAQSAMLNVAEQIAAKKETDPVKRREIIENNVFNNKARKRAIIKKVLKQRNNLKKLNIELSDAEVQEAIFEGMEQSFSEETRQIANRHAERSIFVNDPTGMMGVMYDVIEKVVESSPLTVTIGNTKVKPFRLLMPFTRVAANVTSHLMELTPVGIAKGWANNPNAEEGVFNRALTEADAKMAMGRGIAGSMLMGSFMSLAYAFKDEERPLIEFYGYPPKGKYREWKQQGIDPFSMRIGDTIIPLQGTSLAILPAIIGGSMESIKAGEDVIDVAQTAALASLGAVSTMSFLKPAGDLFDYIVGSKDAVTSETGSADKRAKNYLKGLGDTLISGFIPASGFLNNLGRYMNESPAETYNNLAAKVLGEMPYAREMGVGKPQLNIFGKPITTTLQQRFFAGLTPHTIKTDPVFLWMQETGYSVQDPGPIVRLSTKQDKAKFAKSQEVLTGYADILDEEQSRRVLEISGPQIEQFLRSISRQPRFQVKSEAGQKYINEKVNQFRARAKLQVLGQGRAQAAREGLFRNLSE